MQKEKDRREKHTSEVEFQWMKDHKTMENPYLEPEDDADEDYEDDTTPASHSSQLSDWTSTSRNAPTTSIRSRSTTGESALAQQPRMQPPGKLNDLGRPALALRTQQLQTLSPSQVNMESYFSPSVESPMLFRTSNSSGMFPFPRQAMTLSGNDEGPTRHTAPAGGRTVSRETPGPMSSLRSSANAASQAAQRLAQTQNRLRSASSPDMHNPQNSNRRAPTNDAPAVPTVPSHFAHINRSQAASPNGHPWPAPQILPHMRVASANKEQHPTSSLSRSVTPIGQKSPPLPPPPPSAATPENTSDSYHDARPEEPPAAAIQKSTHHQQPSQPAPSSSSLEYPSPSSPTQLKIKVRVPSEGSSMTLVVSTNITYESLRARIDAKLARATNLVLDSGGAKLKYMDEDGDLVTIQGDEDVQIAFESWREARSSNAGESMGEIELFCTG